MLVVCEKWAGDEDRLLYWASSTSFSSWLGCSTVGHWGPKAPCLPPALTPASCFQLTQTVSDTWLYHCPRPPASAVFPLIYTGASLNWRLGRGSIYNICVFVCVCVCVCVCIRPYVFRFIDSTRCPSTNENIYQHNLFHNNTLNSVMIITLTKHYTEEFSGHSGIITKMLDCNIVVALLCTFTD